MNTYSTKTKVTMDSGKEYIFNESYDDFLAKLYDSSENENIYKSRIIHGDNFVIFTEHIKSIEGIEST